MLLAIAIPVLTRRRLPPPSSDGRQSLFCDAFFGMMLAEPDPLGTVTMDVPGHARAVAENTSSPQPLAGMKA